MSSRRRNGKLASCEPCRKDKVRCDHAQPCSRCRQRGSTRRCFYHPAPLTRTRRRDRSPSQEPVPLVESLSSLEQQDAGTYSTRNVTSNSGINDLLTMNSSSGQLLPTGYLGPTSFIPAIEDGNGVNTSDELHSLGELSPVHLTASAPWSAQVIEVVQCLQDFPLIKSLIHDYFAVSQSTVIAAPFILRALAQIEETIYCDTVLGGQEGISTLATSIVTNTRKPFDVPSTMDGTGFHELYTGSSLRAEILGVIYALAGRACVFGISSTPPSRFSHKMLAASDVTIQICKALSSVNDLFLWLVHENLLLSNIVGGDLSSMMWHRLGELAKYVFEMGLHRELDPAKSSCIPTFLLESRRRLFAAAYQLDKSICTLLGRPPRISWRYSDCQLPLDISDEALAGDANALSAAQDSLDAEGWNTEPTFQRASWIRLRFIMGKFREEILELACQKPSTERNTQLRDISQRCCKTWEALPDHFHYTPSCWVSDLPVGIKIMLVFSYLGYLHDEFLIQKLLHQEDYVPTSSPLVDVSSTILSTVLMLGKQQERSVDLRRDVNWVILLYGFSSASVLLKDLQTTESQQQTPGSRSALIRNLSVFISQLESMARPDQANHVLFDRAAKMFGRIMDEILEPKMVPQASQLDADLDLRDEVDTSILLDLNEAELWETWDFAAMLDQTMF